MRQYACIQTRIPTPILSKEKKSDLLASTYGGEQTAFDTLEKLGESQKMQLITLAGAAVGVKDRKGKVKVKQTLENQASGTSAFWGGFWDLLIGLVFLAPIFGGSWARCRAT